MLPMERAVIEMRRTRGESRRARRPPRRAVEPEAVRGRAWINGREVGGADPRYAHLGGAYD